MSDLVENIGRYESVTSEVQATILHLAVKNNDLIATRHVNAMDECRFTALYIAALTGFVEMVKTLLEAGADVHIPDGGDDAQYALHMAAAHGHCGIVRLLLQ